MRYLGHVIGSAGGRSGAGAAPQLGQAGKGASGCSPGAAAHYHPLLLRLLAPRPGQSLIRMEKWICQAVLSGG